MTETALPVSKSVQDWLATGESLYAAVVSEYRALEAQLAELEGRIREKSGELNQIARVLSKPPVEHARAGPAPAQPGSQVAERTSLEQDLKIRPALGPPPARATQPPAAQKVEIRRRPAEAQSMAAAL